MSFSFRAVTVLFSLLLHCSIAAVGFLFAGGGFPQEEKVYHVSLAEFASTSYGVALQEAMQQMEPAVSEMPESKPAMLPPDSESAAFSTPPKPQPRPQPKPERSRSKPVESKPQQTAAQSAQPGTQQAPAPRTSATDTPGGTPRMNGGMNAYPEDAVDQRPSISRRVLPEYPPNAQRRNIQGEVVVRIVVDTSGTPQQCVIYSSVPEGIFDNAALAAARKTRFIPGKVKGQPVNTIVLIPYRFALR